MIRWAIITGEYPPQPGGVSDYTRQVAAGLVAAGDRVVVYAPAANCPPCQIDEGVIVQRLSGHFGGRGLAALDAALDTRPRPDRLLVQYVPHAFGLKGMNVPFAAWAAARARSLSPLWVMFHEVVFPFAWRPVSHALLGGVTRLNARLLAGAAERVFVSIPAWGVLLSRLAPHAARSEWLPIPSNVGSEADQSGIAAVRSRFAPPPGGRLVGHFGTYGELITDLLAPAAVTLLRVDSAARLLLIGRNSDRFRAALCVAQPDLAGRVAATGHLPAAAVPAHLRACDLLLQPYPDGVSSRRTSVMAGLANGVPVVTNLGMLSEEVWPESNCVALAPRPDPTALAALAAGGRDWTALGRWGAEVYRAKFGLERTLAGLQGCGPPQ